MAGLPVFPAAQQAQIVRAHQRDLYHVSSLREQTDHVLRAWLGTRWLTRWNSEVELFVKLIYYGFTTGRATQTLGEEYTDIWQHWSSTRQTPPPPWVRSALVLLPTLPHYILSRFVNLHAVQLRSPVLARLLKSLPAVLEVISEVNLAAFYLQGVYYSVVKRVTSISYLSSKPENPHVRPPSYSLLGILIGVRLLYRLVKYTRSLTHPEQQMGQRSNEKRHADRHETFLDDRPVSTLLEIDLENEPPTPAEEDKGTMLDVSAILPEIRASRNCTLCLEERTDTCSTECGHLFCWNCIIGWGREKAECPLCRQSLSLTCLLPIYNL
ncbi:peroxisome biogenesis factor 10 [Marasmius sp. AFHP31]|nr:peroxisome biogenesis factor 10 [Marasmius sp. AFHP31]